MGLGSEGEGRDFGGESEAAGADRHLVEDGPVIRKEKEKKDEVIRGREEGWAGDRRREEDMR